MSQSALSIVFAGGGTGGHLSPGIAIAQEFMSRNPENSILFIGTDRPTETAMLSRAGFDHRAIAVEGLVGRGVWQQLGSMMKLPRAVLTSMGMLRACHADLVIGVGGYSAGPVVLGAWLLHIKRVLQEQNTVPGMTNRLLKSFAHRIYVSFEQSGAYFPSAKVMVTGNPIRAEFLACAHRSNVGGRYANERKGPFTVVVTGGSQGAHRLNMILIEALQHIDNKEEFFFIHQTGAEDETMVRQAYQRHGLLSRVQPFFDDMAAQYQAADLIVCRAGATTVSEVTVMGKGVLFVPYPFHGDTHQVQNARIIKEAGGADMILQEDLNGKVLMERIAYYASHKDALSNMASKARSMGRSDAAAVIVDDCYRLVRPQ